MGNQQSSIREPLPTAEPSKSSLSRSKSVLANADTLVQPLPESSRYPRSGPYDDVVRYQRTKPYDGSDPFASGMTGTESPQWGWYTHHTTPPTPEYYYRHPKKHVSRSSNTSTLTSTTENSDASDSKAGQLPVAGQPNPVFKILQNKYKTNPHAWNVPC
jgi:hypothetical protein